MSDLMLVIIFSLIGSVIALSAGALFIARKSWAKNLARFATPFAAGALLAAAFVDLLPEAAHESDFTAVSLAALAGIMLFFFIERFMHWFHHHQDDHQPAVDRDAKVPLIITGNLLHRAIDAVAIAAGFLVSPSIGIVVTAVIVAHEIPHTIGAFGLLIKKKMSRSQVIWVNIIISLLTTIIAATIFMLGKNLELPLGILLGLTAGFFIYIAVSDIIPDIHDQEDRKFVGWQSLMLIAGLLVVGLISTTLHGYMNEENGHDHGHESNSLQHLHDDSDKQDHDDDDHDH